MLPALVLSLAYLIVQPPSADLAAQTFRADLFSSHGFVLWSNDWYSGHLVPGYSLLYPPLAAATSPRLVGAIAAVAAAGLFSAISKHRWGDRARIGNLWFGVASATMLFSGRLTFALGVAVALGSLLALQRGHRRIAGVIALLTACASPVAALFLGLAGAALMAAGQRRDGAAIAFGAGIGLAALTIAFPVTGDEPFVFAAFLPVPIFAALALWLLPTEERALRWGVLLYLLLSTVLFLFPNPVGGNASRLGQLAAGPLLAVVLAARRRPWALALAAVPLLYWQLGPPLRDVSAAAGDPSVNASYYAPLLHQLRDRATEPMRIEIPPTQDRWEAAYVAPRFPLARGWMRQLESGDSKLFTDDRLSSRSYRRWLYRNGIRFVAVPDANRDYLARDEVAVIRKGPSYLHEVWSNEHWKLFRVRGGSGLAGGGARVVKLDPDAFTLAVPGPGRYLVRIHYTRYWRVTSGHACAARQGDWTRIQARRATRVHVEARLSLGGLIGRDDACSG
jgi:hypothetical protein